MKEEFKIAWRNLWRNKRRTLITSASVFFAVFFAIVLSSYQLGSYDHMIKNFIESFTGYLQVQNAKYQDNPMIDYSFSYNDSMESKIMEIEKVVSVAPHIESFTLASSGTQTKGVAVMAIDTEKEKRFSNPENKLVRYRITEEALKQLKAKESIPQGLFEKIEENTGRSYSSEARIELEQGLNNGDIEKYMPLITRYFEVPSGYLTKNDDGVLVSDRLASYLKLGIGDSVILMGQGYHGVSAAGIFPVRGIIKLPLPEIDNKLIVMTIHAAQKYYSVEGKITSLAINLTDKSEETLKEVKNQINSFYTDGETVAKTWYELNPILQKQIQGDYQSGKIMLFILYFIIFFGIFGTVLMMVSERRKEFGVLIAIGMQKNKLKRIITIEMLLLGALGLVSGIIASVPLILYYYYNPILLKGEMAKVLEDMGWDPVMPAAWFGPYIYCQAAIVVLMILLATFYALRKIAKLKEIEALRN